MAIDFVALNEKVLAAEKAGTISREEAILVRNQVATLTRPGCPPKLVLALTHAVNSKLMSKVV